MDKNKKEYLNNLLSIRINQYKMLNNTLTEMFRKNGNKELIESMKKEINETLNEIEKIKFDLNDKKETNSEENVTYSFYNDFVETVALENSEKKLKDNEKKESGFYDSVVKQSKAAEFKMAEYSKKDHTNLDYKRTYANNKSYEKKNLSNKYIDEISNTIDSRLLSNRFLVHLNDSLNIPEIMVKSVAFDLNEGQLSITVYDFVKEIDGKNYSVLELLNDAPSTFKFTIERLNANEKTIYTEKYFGCHIDEIFRDSIDYSNTEFSTIQFLVGYDEVIYETNNKKE